MTFYSHRRLHADLGHISSVQLREMVARATRPSVRELFGIGGVDADYDPKAPWARGVEVGQNRVEQPRATYPAGARPVAKSVAQKPLSPARPDRPIKT